MLEAGRRILDPVLLAAGFQWAAGASGPSSGGAFARAEYVRGARRLELHVRHSLGLVRYHLESLSVSHADYLRAIPEAAGHSQYPGFSDDPVDGFRHLAHDLERFGSTFLSADDAELRRLLARACEAAGSQ